MQFTLRSLIRLTVVASLLFAFAQRCTRDVHPDALVVVMIVSIPLALFGLLLLTQSAFLAFSMWVTSVEDLHHLSNARNCARMTGGGLVAITPAAYSVAMFLRDL
tara:strand:+ start:1814 stop:2128 length:315 start_codon:yes stop_codon:yes gene_type:complete